MSEPQQPEDNPYLATQVADIATSVSDRSRPGTNSVTGSRHQSDSMVPEHEA